MAKRLARDIELPPGEVDALEAALRLWLDLEGWAFEVRQLGPQGRPAGDAVGLEVSVSGSPWWEAMCCSGRRDAVDCSAVERALPGWAGGPALPAVARGIRKRPPPWRREVPGAVLVGLTWVWGVKQKR